MNYYSHGGQAHGLKSLAQELPKYGRNGDTIVAHINPQEAGILKALGGSGTINPHTGLPEFGFFSGITNAVRSIVQPVYNATLKNIPGVDQALVGLDKGIGSIIPGGWGTLASIAGSAVGLPTWALTGLGALTGSGALKKDGRFNLQGALMGGAMAYGMSQLGQGLAEAGGGANPTAGDVAGKLGVEGASTAPGSQAAMLAEQNAGFGTEGLKSIGSSAAPAIEAAKAAGTGFTYSPSGEMIPTQAVNVVPQTGGVSDLFNAAKNSVVAEGKGLANLSGLAGPEGTAAAARTAFTGPVTSGGMTALTMGTMGTMQLDEQQKYLDQQLAAGNVSQAEYNAEAARIADAKARAEQAVRENPYMFAVGGSVDDESGMDEARGLDQGNMSNGFMGGGVPSYAMGGNVSTQPRFLSGGGDGMSDSIPATINGRQEARLADGEFVIPADVVSHLGNGSSKAGANRLYSMMDKVRSARTGTKKQAPAVNARKLMPA